MIVLRSYVSVTVYGAIRSYTEENGDCIRPPCTKTVNDRFFLRISPYVSVYGRLPPCLIDLGTFGSLRIFIRSPYTESVSHRFTPYTVPVYGTSVRPPYISVFLRKRSFTTVHIRPGKLSKSSSFWSKYHQN